MRLTRLAISAAAFLCSSTAFAGAPAWTISESSGPVNVVHAGVTKVVARGGSLAVGDIVQTGARGRAVLVRGQEYLIVSPNSRISIADPAQSGGFIQIVQNWGSAIFKIEKKTEKHFAVKTPYLAAVVKGTTFNITVDEKGARVQVTEGRVEVATPDGKAVSMVMPGELGLVSINDRLRLRIQGAQNRIIDSPQRPAAGDSTANLAPVPDAGSADAAPSATESSTTSTADEIAVPARTEATKNEVAAAPTKVEPVETADGNKESSAKASSPVSATLAAAPLVIDPAVAVADTPGNNATGNAISPAPVRITAAISEGAVILASMTSGLVKGDSSLVPTSSTTALVSGAGSKDDQPGLNRDPEPVEVAVSADTGQDNQPGGKDDPEPVEVAVSADTGQDNQPGGKDDPEPVEVAVSADAGRDDQPDRRDDPEPVEVAASDDKPGRKDDPKPAEVAVSADTGRDNQPGRRDDPEPAEVAVSDGDDEKPGRKGDPKPAEVAVSDGDDDDDKPSRKGDPKPVQLASTADSSPSNPDRQTFVVGRVTVTLEPNAARNSTRVQLTGPTGANRTTQTTTINLPYVKGK